ncbi:MAG TPA: sigma-70 family RNA polymerase sigma factor [Planctomycetota bacterium]|nr:sigma-70 family RNA polymerase sigma factor [Planctomycetota bacterium]
MDACPGGDQMVPADADLVRQARAGGKQGFESLVRRYQGLVVARAYAVLHDRAEAEDAAQEAFLRAFRSLGQLRNPAAFAPWLLQTVVNVARRAASRRARHAVARLGAEVADRREPHPEVLDAVAALPEGYQQVIHLHYSQGCSCEEIARLLGLQVGSVTSRLTRARQMLRKSLTEDRGDR